MTLIEALKTTEDLLEKVSAAGEENWNRLSDSKKIIRAVRMDIERQVREEASHGSGADAQRERAPEDDAGTV